jgi:hypothetical protein
LNVGPVLGGSATRSDLAAAEAASAVVDILVSYGRIADARAQAKDGDVENTNEIHLHHRNLGIFL